MPAQATPAQTTNLFLLEDLEDVSRTSELAEGDLDALRSIAEWIKTYVVKPHKELIGRVGTVCPFLPGSLERKTLWLAPEHVADGGAPKVLELMDGYKRRLQEAEPTDGDVNYNVIAVRRVSAQETSLIPVYEIDDVGHATANDMLRGQPKSPACQGHRHEGTDRPSAAEVLVRSDDEALDPVCDGLQRIKIASREFTRPADVLEILEEEETSGRCWHGTVS